MSSLPLPAGYHNDDTYIRDLLSFVTGSSLLNELCGGVHILDFFCQKPDIYESIFPEGWRHWFDQNDLEIILDFILRDDLSTLPHTAPTTPLRIYSSQPPDDLVDYVRRVRALLLERDHARYTGAVSNDHPAQEPPDVPRHIAVGMKRKKLHEVQNIARYVSALADKVEEATGEQVTHLVDFGSGQNYLGRVLASEPYNRHVIGLESKVHNVEAAKAMDVFAKLAPKAGIRRNKKEWRAQQQVKQQAHSQGRQQSQQQESRQCASKASTASVASVDGLESEAATSQQQKDRQTPPTETNNVSVKAASTIAVEGKGTVQYVQHKLQDGDITAALEQTIPNHEQVQTTGSHPDNTNTSVSERRTKPNIVVISLHSCGNLSHHGLRSLVLNPDVRAVAIVGCCYNLLTDRLTSPSYKIPGLRPDHPVSNSTDPHGFPMSDRLCTYAHADGSRGINLNITARMMAVQAPQNWSAQDSDDFFTRHFYRALLQRVFVDRGVVDAPEDGFAGGLGAKGTAGQAIIIGSLRKHCYTSFLAYVRGALAKLAPPSTEAAEDRQPWHPPAELSERIAEKTADLTDEEIEGYARRYAHRKKQLSIVWTMMAYSAGLVEAVVVVDRWLWLREQMSAGIVKDCWVESVFDYALSPRNLVVCGIKK